MSVDVWGATEEWTTREGQKRSDKAWYLSGIQVHRDAPAPAQSLSPPTPQSIAQAFGGRVIDDEPMPF